MYFRKRLGLLFWPWIEQPCEAWLFQMKSLPCGIDRHDLFFIHRNRRAWCDRGLLVPEEKPVGQLNRIVVEDANRHGLTGGGGGSAGGGFGAPVPGTLNQINSNPRSQALNHGRITVNPGHHGFENTTIVANIKFGPKGNVLLAGGNDLSNSNTGQSLIIFPYYVRTC